MQALVELPHPIQVGGDPVQAIAEDRLCENSSSVTESPLWHLDADRIKGSGRR